MATDSRKFPVAGYHDYILEPDGSMFNRLLYQTNRKGMYYAPWFIGDGVMGTHGEVYVVIGSPYDHKGHRVHRLVELIAESMHEDPSQVWFKDGDPLNVKRSNLGFGPKPEPKPEQVEGEPRVTMGSSHPGVKRPPQHPFNERVQCPHCDMKCSRYNLKMHMKAKHPGKAIPQAK